jgi:hypothetical protein
MDTAENKRTEGEKNATAPPASPVLHRVCIQCNNMFRVTPDKFDAKQCPKCHKG